eukprot:gnl/MRDRNA2_/MRDRNA2_108645_c0_seq1.p1 gnl/MRDRNA2_/MRDRNA2_108645_c0~~gnl/MRDRNA2_/MRDRNA2_108645_c0_seq1.p1  ORF type:complete len:448 (+),score=65.50 gnl/MRDRNA2_/MRDRNA2_108645_c0_seq1:151-1494(+)
MTGVFLFHFFLAVLVAEGGQEASAASSSNAQHAASKGSTKVHSKVRTRIPWTLGTFPNPQVNFDLCGRGGKASHICDPENLLNPSLLDFEDLELSALDQFPQKEREGPPASEVASGPWRGLMKSQRVSNTLAVTEGATSKEGAPCSAEGFRVFVAVVDEIDRDYLGQYYGLEEAAREFGWALGERWKVLKTPCRNGIIVLFVVSDQYMVILPDAGRASEALPDELSRHVAYGAVKALHVYPDEILSHALANLKAILQGSYDSHRLEYDRTMIFLYVLSGCFGLVCVLLTVCGFYDGFSRWRHLSRYRTCREKIERAHQNFQQGVQELSMCPICIGSFPKGSENFKSGTHISFICGHRFHSDCCESWSHRFPRSAGRCPVCDVPQSSAATNPNDDECEVKKFVLRSLRDQYPEIISEHHLERWASCNTEIWLAELAVPQYLSIWHHKE